jgi:2-polyprenyl-3-methyl-5-hydroxy-6-metoxy-1,4-benzoquinol methylase
VKQGFPVARCRTCGLVYVDADLDSARMQERYGAGYYGGEVFHDYAGERAERIASARSHCQLLAQIVPSGRLLDVGCAMGFFLEAASERWDVTGVELSGFAADYAMREFGHPVLTGDVSSVDLPERSFDLVTVWNTIEHMADPRAAMARIARVAAPGALVVITTGNVSGPLARRNLAAWDLMTPPEHLYFFAPNTIGNLLDKAGFEVRRVVQDGIVAKDDRPLRSARSRTIASAVGLGNVMTVYARRSAVTARRTRALRGLGWRLRPVRRV